MIFTKQFWLDSVERAIKSFAQSAITLIGSDATGYTHLAWEHVAGVSAVVALLSVLTSVATASVTKRSSASAVPPTQ